MNEINKELINQLKQFLKENNILTDLEDRYVYSFEKIFLDQTYPTPDIVVRISSLEDVPSKDRINVYVDNDKKSFEDFKYLHQLSYQDKTMDNKPGIQKSILGWVKELLALSLLPITYLSTIK